MKGLHSANPPKFICKDNWFTMALDRFGTLTLKIFIGIVDFIVPPEDHDQGETGDADTGE